MPRIVVQKYGGSSVADVAKLRHVARRVAQTAREDARVVVVVSAMGDTTDDLLGLARELCETPDRRELDMLLTAGERISMSLLAMALKAEGCEAISFTGSQSGIMTNDRHVDARIVEVRPFRIQDELERGRVVIVAGYQGVSYRREVTTLGRGGSDTTAVALAAALQAEACEIYSDVAGVYSADPRVVPEAKRLAEISYEEMQELAEAGAKVLNAQAVEFAKQSGIAIYARATAGGPEQTVVRRFPPPMPGRVAGVTSSADMWLLEAAPSVALDALLGMLDELEVPARQVASVARGPVAGTSLVVGLQDLHNQAEVRAALEGRFGAAVEIDAGVGAVSCIGAGINRDHGNLRRTLKVAAEQGVVPLATHTSSFRITQLVPQAALPELTRGLHSALIGE